MVGLVIESISILIRVIEVLIVVRILLSLLGYRGNNRISLFVYQMTEPVLEPARRLISKLGVNTGMFDFSPLITIMVLRLLSNYLISRVI